MKYLLIIIAIVAVNACSYKPVIDTAGRSGTFKSDRASEITNDLQHCKTIAKANSSLIEDFSHWLWSPNAETKSKVIYKKCLTNRGHSVLN